MDNETAGLSRTTKHTMIGAYAIFALAVALAISFVFTIHQWLAKEDELTRH